MPDQLFWRLCAVHPALITDTARRFMLPIKHPEAWDKTALKKISRVRRFRRVTVKEEAHIEPSLTGILLDVSTRSGFSANDLRSESRNAKLCHARHEFFYLASRDTTRSYVQIGKFISGRDHTTVMNSIRVWARKNQLSLPRGLVQRPVRRTYRKIAERGDQHANP